MSYYNNAVKLRPFIEKAAASLSDEDALQAVPIFPMWNTNTQYEENIRIRHNDILYKCFQAHTSQDNWTPDATPALWTVVSIESGTQDKPITAVRGMEYEQDKYYLDAYDGNTYLCIRSATLQYLPHELIGHYFSLI